MEADRIKQRDAWVSRGVNLLSAGLGALAASVLHEGPIPTETLDWIIHNGLQGGALVGCVVLGTAYAVEKRSLRKVLDERNQRNEDRADKMEQLYLAQLQDVKEQRKVIQRSREAHEASNEVLKEIAGEDPV